PAGRPRRRGRRGGRGTRPRPGAGDGVRTTIPDRTGPRDRPRPGTITDSGRGWSPRGDVARAETGPVGAATGDGRSGMTAYLLVVEDDPDIGPSLTRALQVQGYDAELAPDAAAAE